MEKLKNIKGRCWAFVCYPDSLPDDWVESVRNCGLPMAFSPLHDKDLNPTGEEKKPHYHVICYYENPTTANNVYNNVCKPLNATIPIKLESMRGMYRYHIHLDNPEKYQYNDSDREFFNGFDVSLVSSLTATEEFKLLRQIIIFINDNKIFEYSDLINILINNELFDMFEVACRKNSVLSTYISSKRNKSKDMLTKKIIDDKL